MFTYTTNCWPQAWVSAKKFPGQSCDSMNPALLKTRWLLLKHSQEARTGNEEIGLGITALTRQSFAIGWLHGHGWGLKVSGGSRPCGLHERFRSTKTKETGFLYCFLFVTELFFVLVRKSESRGPKVEWRPMEDLFEKAICAQHKGLWKKIRGEKRVWGRILEPKQSGNKHARRSLEYEANRYGNNDTLVLWSVSTSWWHCSFHFFFRVSTWQTLK